MEAWEVLSSRLPGSTLKLAILVSHSMRLLRGVQFTRLVFWLLQCPHLLATLLLGPNIFVEGVDQVRHQRAHARTLQMIVVLLFHAASVMGKEVPLLYSQCQM
jgi:hypothetical protein